ncbi:MAG: hypothetical protein ABSE28_19550 [Candidatus Sulfotelmatobacter sp.]|jgi:hypothetical protein
MHREYASAIPHPEVIAPEGYTLDCAAGASGERGHSVGHILDYANKDYANKVKLYPKLQEYFKEWKPRL